MGKMWRNGETEPLKKLYVDAENHRVGIAG